MGEIDDQNKLDQDEEEGANHSKVGPDMSKISTLGDVEGSNCDGNQ